MIPLQVEEFIVPLQSKPRAARGTPKGLPRCEAALPAPQALYPPVGPYTLRSSLTRAAGALPAALLLYTLRSSFTRAAGALPAAPLL